MKTWQFWIFIILVIITFLILIMSPIGWRKSFSIAGGKSDGKICYKSFCSKPATESVYYRGSKTGRQTTMHYCSNHIGDAPQVSSGSTGGFGFFCCILLAVISLVWLYAIIADAFYPVINSPKVDFFILLRSLLFWLILSTFGTWICALLF